MPVKNDGSVPYGSRVLSIPAGTPTPAATNFVAEDITITRPTSEIMRRNEINEPNGRVVIAEFVKGTAVLQRATNTTPFPDLGAEFTADFGYGTSETFYIDSIETPENQAQEKKLRIGFTKKYNA